MAKPLLTDDLWERIRPHLPPEPKGGRPRVPDRGALTGILFVLRTGIPWEMLLKGMGCGCGMTCWRRLHDWQAAGVWKKVWRIMLDTLGASNRIEWGAAVIDSCSTRALFGGQNRLQSHGSREEWHETPFDRGRGGDAAGHRAHGRQRHDSRMAIALVDAIPRIRQPDGTRRRRPVTVFADRAYDAEVAIREALRKRGIIPFIPKRNSQHGSGLGEIRHVVKAAFAWLFNNRRLRVRYDKRDDIHDAFLILGCLLICWRRVREFC